MISLVKFGDFRVLTGETEQDLIPVVQKLQSHGVGAILDYAAEAEVESGPKIFSTSPSVKAAYHESNTAALMSSITSAAKVQARDHADRFAALKVRCRH